MKALAALVVTAAATAQDIAVELRLAADATRSGPAAWTWLREHLVPELEGWPAEGDAFGPLVLRWRDGRLGWSAGTAGELGLAYARTEITLGGSPTAHASCSWAGHGTLTATPSASLPARAAELAATLGLDLPGGRSVDVAVLAGQLVRTPAHDGGPIAELLTRGAVECGVLRFTVERDAEQVTVRGVSRGGLVLPFAIVLLAALDGEPSALDVARDRDDGERWRLLAFGARDDARAEAAAQLARIGDDRAVDVLRRLLWCDGHDRVHAMHGLIRAGAAEALPAIVGAARDELAATPELAHAALVNLWDGAAPEERGRARVAAGSHAWFDDSGQRVEPGGGSLRGFVIGLLTATSLAAFVAHEWLRGRVR